MKAEEKKTQVTNAPAAAPATPATGVQHRPAGVAAETSALGEKLNEFWEGLKQGQSRAFWYIAGGVVVVIVLFFVWRYFSAAAEQKNAARWVELLTIADTPEPEPVKPGEAQPQKSPVERQMEALEAFIKANEGTPQARVGRFQIARLRLSNGLSALRANPPAAADQIRVAAEDYERLIAESADTPLLQEEALLNAGKARETLGDLDRARGHFEQLVKDHKDSAAGKEADVLLKRLNDPAGRAEIEKLADALKAAGPAPGLPPGFPGLPPGHPPVP